MISRIQLDNSRREARRLLRKVLDVGLTPDMQNEIRAYFDPKIKRRRRISQLNQARSIWSQRAKVIVGVGLKNQAEESIDSNP